MNANKKPSHAAKMLLVAIERRDLHRNDVVLADLCNANEEVFGASGSKERRDLQFWWNNVKRRSIRRYCSLLDDCKIGYSSTTRRLLNLEQRVPSPESQASSTETQSLYSNRSTTSSSRTTKPSPPNNDSDLEEGMDSKSLVSTAFSPTRLFNSPPIKASSHQKPLLFGSPSQNMATWQNSSEDKDILEISGAMANQSFADRQDYVGSRTNPFQINVDFEHGERAYPFEVVRVSRIEHGGWAREGICIRMNVGVDDNEHWRAWMDDTPGLEGRSIIIRGRCRSSAFDALNEYHRQSPHPDEKSAHEALKDAIYGDSSRQSFYWRLIVNEQLDNVLLSGDAKQILRRDVGIVYMAGEDNDVECRACFVSWTIAKAKVGVQLVSAKKKNLKSLFD